MKRATSHHKPQKRRKATGQAIRTADAIQGILTRYTATITGQPQAAAATLLPQGRQRLTRHATGRATSHHKTQRRRKVYRTRAQGIKRDTGQHSATQGHNATGQGRGRKDKRKRQGNSDNGESFYHGKP